VHRPPTAKVIEYEKEIRKVASFGSVRILFYVVFRATFGQLKERCYLLDGIILVNLCTSFITISVTTRNRPSGMLFSARPRFRDLILTDRLVI
jgi:hypothetical protein